ncbi:hypothetical protein BKA80DRAFT_275051 [Phyllosticta citrichinensis]
MRFSLARVLAMGLLPARAMAPVVMLAERASAASRRASLASWTAALEGGGSLKRSSNSSSDGVDWRAATGDGERVAGGDAGVAADLGLGFRRTSGLTTRTFLVTRGAPGSVVSLVRTAAVQEPSLRTSTGA